MVSAAGRGQSPRMVTSIPPKEPHNDGINAIRVISQQQIIFLTLAPRQHRAPVEIKKKKRHTNVSQLTCPLVKYLVTTTNKPVRSIIYAPLRARLMARGMSGSEPSIFLMLHR